MPGIEACAPGSSDPDGWVVDGRAADGAVPVGCGAGVPACTGARGDRMPGTEAGAPDGSDPDGCAAVGCGAGA